MRSSFFGAVVLLCLLANWGQPWTLPDRGGNLRRRTKSWSGAAISWLLFCHRRPLRRPRHHHQAAVQLKRPQPAELKSLSLTNEASLTTYLALWPRQSALNSTRAGRLIWLWHVVASDMNARLLVQSNGWLHHQCTTAKLASQRRRLPLL